jgi:hypothetical protein
MCDDSPAERRFWIQKMEQVRKEMEQEELERQRQPATTPAKPAAEEPQPLPV